MLPSEADSQPTAPPAPSRPSTGNGRGDKEPRILRAAVEVFAEHGYHATRVSQVAELAGVATGTIYLYFSKKEDLLVTLFERYLGAYLERSRGQLETTRAGAARLRKLIELHLAFFAEDKQLARVFQIHVREPDPVIREGIQPMVIRYFDTIAWVIQTGIDAGELDPELDVRLARKVFFGALDELVTGWVRARKDYPLMDLHEAVSKLVGRALGVHEGGDK